MGALTLGAERAKCGVDVQQGMKEGFRKLSIKVIQFMIRFNSVLFDLERSPIQAPGWNFMGTEKDIDL